MEPREKGHPSRFVETPTYRAPVPVRDELTAATCTLCRTRKAALSPYTIGGIHDGPGHLPAPVVDAVHRVTTDPGRLKRHLKRQWFDELMAAGVGDSSYVELVGIAFGMLRLRGKLRRRP